MEMYGGQKANKTMETTMAARDNGPWRWHCVYALWCPRSFVHSPFFLPLFSTSAVTLLPLLLLSFSGSCCCCCYCCCYCFLHGWSRAQRSQLVLCERSEKIVAQLLRQLHEYLQAPPQRGSAWRRALQDNSRQFTCTSEGSASSFWASESESERGRQGDASLNLA